jgi:TPR repeat protein
MAILTGCSPSSQDVSINTTKKTDGMHSIVASATIEPASNPIISSRKLPPDMEAESEIPFLNNPNILSTAKTFYISPVDRIKLAEAGENGDGEAAFKLAQFYNFSVKNPELERHWLRISATNDHLVGQYNLAYTLINWGTSAEEKEEGMQLMRKYANNGNEHAIIFFRQREYQKKHNNS